MEYIEKIGSCYFAREGDVEIDNVKFFDSRRNYDGISGPYICIQVNDYALEWYSNFYYGSMEFSYATLSFKGIFIRTYGPVSSTQAFVDLLNRYTDASKEVKDDIILELANRLAHFRKKAGWPKNSTFLKFRSKFFEPTIEFDKLPHDIGLEYIQASREETD